MVWKKIYVNFVSKELCRKLNFLKIALGNNQLVEKNNVFDVTDIKKLF